MPGNPFVKRLLCQCAWVISRTRKNHLNAWFWSRKSRLGAKKATIAVSRKLLVTIYAMLKSGTLYDLHYEQNRKLIQNNAS
jgi:transposase